MMDPASDKGNYRQYHSRDYARRGREFRRPLTHNRQQPFQIDFAFGEVADLVLQYRPASQKTGVLGRCGQTAVVKLAGGRPVTLPHGYGSIDAPDAGQPVAVPGPLCRRDCGYSMEARLLQIADDVQDRSGFILGIGLVQGKFGVAGQLNCP